MLTTNMIRKDISASNQYDAGLALTGLACFITPDLARDLANDVLALMSSSRPFLKKKAIYVMYKVSGWRSSWLENASILSLK